ncbi:MAG: polyhydroxybutyrate depolymerase [Solirubrobacteraceae bacterium]|nr:polyhydroxybutyrate depolymerase [Solirubrobacteraceae bacterium]
MALLVAACGSSSSADPVAQTSGRAAAPAGAGRASAACTPGAPAPASKLAGAPLDTILRVPAKARGHRAPLILALHFASGTGAQMEQATRYTPEAARSGFVVAYPTASANHFWSIDRDFAKLQQTLDAIERVACIDPARVYVSGISNGGFMSTVLACRSAGRIAAAVLFAPGVNGIGDCEPSRPISVLEVHGTSDPIVPYGAIPGFVAGWAKRDGCASRSTTQQLGATVTIFRWPGCRAGAQVEHLRLTRGKHIELLPQLRTTGVDPAHTAWTFLRAHRLPAA